MVARNQTFACLLCHNGIKNVCCSIAKRIPDVEYDLNYVSEGARTRIITIDEICASSTRNNENEPSDN